MNNTKGYAINFVTREIIITKRFSKAAGVIDSDAYKTMLALRKDFPDFKITIKPIEKKENKVTYKGLSIEEMKRFITANRAKEEQELFEKILKLQEGKKGKYATVKKWFLDKYKNIYTTELEELSKETATKEAA